MPTLPDASLPLLAALALGALWTLESLAPMFAHARDRAAHSLRNLALGLINAIVRAGVFTTLILLVTEWAANARFGLLHELPLPAPAEWALAFLLLDFWNYAWHICCHKLPLLWRFHLVHHHDEHVDATTALRFHVGEIVLTSIALLVVLPILGVTLPQLLLYELVLVPSALFHHANIRIPARLDAALRLVIVTPRMHWVHHSRWQPETDSNYAGVLSIWDRLFGSLRLRPDPRTIELGLDGYTADERDTLGGMLGAPLAPSKSGYGAAPRGAVGGE